MTTQSDSGAPDIYKDSFIPFIVKWGRRTNLFGIVLCFLPCFVLAFMGILPRVDSLITAVLLMLPVIGVGYIYEPLGFFAVLGIPGSYMAFLSGNISNLRVPCSSIAQNAAGVEEGSEKGSIIATIGIAVSILVNLAILTLGVVAGSYVLSKLPPRATEILNLMLPALLASLTVNYIIQKPRLAMVGVPIIVIVSILSGAGVFGALGTVIAILVSVFGTMAIGISLAKKGVIK